MSVSQQQSHLLELETVPLRVAFLGVEGSPGQLAAQARFGGRRGGALLEGHSALAGAVEAVRSGRADVALASAGAHPEGPPPPMDPLSAPGLVLPPEPLPPAREHYTRYLELAHEAPAVPEDVPCKTSVILTLADRAGALDEVLQAFSRQGVNLARLESAPGARHAAAVPFLRRHGRACRRGAGLARLDEARASADVRVVGSFRRPRAGRCSRTVRGFSPGGSAGSRTPRFRSPASACATVPGESCDLRKTRRG